ncbi:tail fiber assembly protein [Citrobacter amalonaticus]|uniref:Tail fiber assembly protein n=1 Tax=Citrobacter amalonaticus TaxID=35703 RepID=A0ABY0HN47_CITAM|nr:tail fiber assembly protein [Citrobacter amalonaticus]MZK91741.1 tail fiber assembly protein [Citrobacter amalonaticus]MZK96350.1 tail fiber assembly protein [Citrobacter amalonaticus]MZL06184.1 tail fiber assembly protein [Citrobacter amalonaticus]MZL26008.1 tail fiber assembly protein [Citrobacter amalonaticus]MZL45326.1 tail fiber assembly protein [Citrobacter amalonaticus]
MTIFYSAITRGFYRTGDNLPVDVIEITQEHFEELMFQQEQGFIIAPDSTGYPVAIENTVDPIEAAAEQKAQLRIMADNEISWRQDAVDAGIATDEETVALADWKKYRVLLMRVDTAKPDWPTLPGEQAS